MNLFALGVGRTSPIGRGQSNVVSNRQHLPGGAQPQLSTAEDDSAVTIDENYSEAEQNTHDCGKQCCSSIQTAIPTKTGSPRAEK
jgi:hypothetical protein